MHKREIRQPEFVVEQNKRTSDYEDNTIQSWIDDIQPSLPDLDIEVQPLFSDAAGTIDGLNPDRMVRDNLVTQSDVDGRASGATFYGYPVLAEGLDNFEAVEKMLVLEALQSAHGALHAVLQRTDALPSVVMRTYFGDGYEQYKNSIIDTWTRTRDLMSEYMKPSVSNGKFFRATSSGHQMAATDPYSDKGLVVILDAFPSEKVTQLDRAATLIHEFSHLSEVSGINIKGSDTQDFFYLAKGDGNEGARSHSILNEVGLKIRGINDIKLLLKEIAIFQHKPVISFRKAGMLYGDITAPEMLTHAAAVEFFNQTPLLRSQVASKNSDSIAYSAMHIGQMLLDCDRITPIESRNNSGRKMCCDIS